MTRLKCIHGQRDASGFDYWFEGMADDGSKVIVSGAMRQAYGSLLVDDMDAQEWREWFSIQEPYQPRKPSPRLHPYKTAREKWEAEHL